MKEPAPAVAMIGAGISGLACATELRARGIATRVFDKGRGPGGRMSTRRVPTLGDSASFDHGAQYFTVRSAEMADALGRWRSAGVVSEWTGPIVSIDSDGVKTPSQSTTRFVGTPAMNAICEHLAGGLDVRSACRVSRIEAHDDTWILRDDQDASLGRFDIVVCTAPPEQTVRLFEPVAEHLAARIAAVKMDPCWALMVAMARPLALDFDGAFINGGPLSWVARTSAKPGRMEPPECWVLHANPRWSESNLEREPADVVQPLLDAFFDAAGINPVEPAWASAHRWRYALADNAIEDGYLYDAQLGIGACGDWTNGNRVEGAWLSGFRLAHEVATRARGPYPGPTSGASNI